MAEAGTKDLRKILTAKPWLITVALAGALVSAVGLALIGAGFTANRETIEIIESRPAASESGQLIFVDVGGAVETPGIYQLPSDARVNDAIIIAGGLAVDADRDWISQNLNLAAKLADGTKVYVPFREETNKDSPRSNLQGLSLKDQININTASLTDLDTLWGVGPATAQKIIDNRPYAKTSDLLDKKIVKTNVYDAIKDKITVL